MSGTLFSSHKFAKQHTIYDHREPDKYSYTQEVIIEDEDNILINFFLDLTP